MPVIFTVQKIAGTTGNPCGAALWQALCILYSEVIPVVTCRLAGLMKRSWGAVSEQVVKYFCTVRRRLSSSGLGLKRPVVPEA